MHPLIEPMQYIEQLENRLTADQVALIICPQGKGNPAARPGEIVPFKGDEPDPEGARILLGRTVAAGTVTPSAFYKEAKHRLKGRDCFDCIFADKELAPPGRRGSTMLSYTAQAIALLYPVAGCTPSHIYALFLPAVQRFTPAKDMPSTAAWTAELWRMIGRNWALEDAKGTPKIVPPAPTPPKPCQPDDELDIQRIIRPELFLTSAVAGVCVPLSVLENDIAKGRWMLYLQWADGRREAVELPGVLNLPDGSRYIIFPIPANPLPNNRPTWTAAHRKAWINGAPTPNALDVFKRLCDAIVDYTDFPPAKAHGSTALLALFVILTYCFPVWDAVPYLYIGGPAGSGKTRVFELLSRLAFRPLVSSNLTSAALFRTLHERGGVLLLDEAERLKESTPDVSEIRTILLAGYKRGGKAQRLKPETFELQEFDVFGPKAVACIAGLPGPLLSRCIPLIMFRCPADSQKPKRRLDDDAERWRNLRDDLHALALGHAPVFLELAGLSEVCPDMTGRHYELWQPILALAAVLDTDLHDRMKRFAMETISENQEDATPDADEATLRALAVLIVRGATPQAKAILDAARMESPELFARYTPKGVANILKRYGLKTVKAHDKRVYRVTMDDLRRIEGAYQIDLNVPYEAKA